MSSTDYRDDYHDSVVLINRTNKELICKFNGRDLPIRASKKKGEVHENVGFPKSAVAHAKAQNPIMGTADYYDPMNVESMVGVKGSKDPVSFVDIDAIDATECFDPSTGPSAHLKRQVIGGPGHMRPSRGGNGESGSGLRG